MPKAAFRFAAFLSLGVAVVMVVQFSGDRILAWVPPVVLAAILLEFAARRAATPGLGMVPMFATIGAGFVAVASMPAGAGLLGIVAFYVTFLGLLGLIPAFSRFLVFGHRRPVPRPRIRALKGWAIVSVAAWGGVTLGLMFDAGSPKAALCTAAYLVLAVAGLQRGRNAVPVWVSLFGVPSLLAGAAGVSSPEPLLRLVAIVTVGRLLYHLDRGRGKVWSWWRAPSRPSSR